MSDAQKPLYTRRFGPTPAVTTTSVSLDEIRRRASKLNGIARARTWIQGPAYLVAVGAFAVQIFMTQSPIARISACLLGIGWGYLLYQVIWSHRQAPGRLPTQQEPEACAAFYRSELARERDYLHRVAIWLPLIFSATVVLILVQASQFTASLARTSRFRGLMIPLIVIMIVIWALLVPFHTWQNFRRAKQCQHEIDRLDASFKAGVGI